MLNKSILRFNLIAVCVKISANRCAGLAVENKHQNSDMRLIFKIQLKTAFRF